jgi:hypothetical protein
VSIPFVALIVSIGSTVFLVGVWFGVLRGKLDRTREHLRNHGQRIRELESFMRRSQVRSRDIEKSLSVVAKRPFLPRYPEDQALLPGEVPYAGTAGAPEPKK